MLIKNVRGWCGRITHHVNRDVWRGLGTPLQNIRRVYIPASHTVFKLRFEGSVDHQRSLYNDSDFD